MKAFGRLGVSTMPPSEEVRVCRLCEFRAPGTIYMTKKGIQREDEESSRASLVLLQPRPQTFYQSPTQPHKDIERGERFSGFLFLPEPN